MNLLGQEAIVLGDSVTAAYGGAVATTLKFLELIGSLMPNPTHPGSSWNSPDATFTPRLTSLAVPSSPINAQRAAYEALSTDKKLYVSYVILQLGLNDLWDTETVTDVMTRYQALVDVIRISSPNARIYAATMPPCKLFWVNQYGEEGGQAVYQKWWEINANIVGNGTLPLQGTYGSITSHTVALNDGAGNLAPIFNDLHDGIHPNNMGRLLIVTSWYNKLVADKTLRVQA